tara:strand:+ start:250 stop:441 length:192 start_codon:yes stop_codon:yes gene_type:complete
MKLLIKILLFIGTQEYMREAAGVIITIDMKRLRLYEDKEIGFWLGVFGFVWIFTLVVRWLMGL